MQLAYLPTASHKNDLKHELQSIMFLRTTAEMGIANSPPQTPTESSFVSLSLRFPFHGIQHVFRSFKEVRS